MFSNNRHSCLDHTQTISAIAKVQHLLCSQVLNDGKQWNNQRCFKRMDISSINMKFTFQIILDLQQMYICQLCEQYDYRK